MIKKIFSFVALLFFTLFIGEVALRHIPSSIQYPLRIQFDNADGIGVVHAKNIRVKNKDACFGPVRYSTNSFGMRDRERALEKIPGVTRVAIIGDSMMDAEQINDEEGMSRLLEEGFEGKAEFLNFGMNSIGPMQYALLYETKIRSFRPDVVMAMFYTENDIENNSIALESLVYHGEPFLTYRDAEGNPMSVITFTKTKMIKQFLNRHFALFRLMREIQSKLKYGKTGGKDSVASRDTPSMEEIKNDIKTWRAQAGALIRHEVFLDPPDAEWEEAWQNTERELLRLKGMVEEDGARLIVVIVPSILEFDGEAGVKIATPLLQAVRGERALDMLYPNRRINALLRTYGFTAFDLLPPMRSYSEEHSLAYPYFSFSCNSHWSALGHRVAADAVSAFLTDRTIVP